jgi:phosphomannomutase
MVDTLVKNPVMHLKLNNLTMTNNWKELQNGSDIRGIAIEGVKGENVNLTPVIATAIAIAFAKWLAHKKQKSSRSLKIGIGHDSRLSGLDLAKACFDGLKSESAEVFDCGLSSTPAMFMSTIFPETEFDGAIMLTASHLPFNRNGMKFFTNKGGLDKPDISDILELCTINNLDEKNVHKPIESVDLISLYADFLVKKIRMGVNLQDNFERPLQGFHIVVDAGNGAGGFFAEKVLQPLGANTTGSQFLNPDGLFPNHIPNPEDKDAMASICEAVKKNNADLGIIFDTDVDRAAAVDKFGNEINRNKLIGLISSIILEEHPETAIVTDSITSDGLTLFIEKDLNGKHHRFKRGYKNVINEAIRLNQMGNSCWCAIETSGHAALKENHFLDDGAFIITKILIKAAELRKVGKTIDSLTEKLKLPHESEEYRIKIQTTDFKSYGNSVIKALEQYVTKVDGWSVVPNNYEGIRVSCAPQNGNGWFLLRLSLHDPEVPLIIESEEEGGVLQIATQLKKFFKNYEHLDITPLLKYTGK